MNTERPNAKRKRISRNDLARALHHALMRPDISLSQAAKRVRQTNGSNDPNTTLAKRMRPTNVSNGSNGSPGQVAGNAYRSVSSAISRRTVSTGRSTMSRGNIANNTNLQNTATSATTLYPHQQEAIMIARRSASSMDKVTHRKKHEKGAPIYRGGLVAHSTGSGKTVTALGIILEYVKRQDMNPYIFIVTTKSNKEQNGLEKYLKNIQTRFPDYAASLVREEVTGQEASAREAALARGFSKHVHYQTFIEFASCLGLYGSRSRQKDTMCKELQMNEGREWKRRGLVVILDEAHELTKADLRDMKPFDEKSDKKNEYQAILQTKAFLAKQSGMGSKTPSSGRRSTITANPLLHIYALTATPGTTSKQYIDTINLVRPANAPKLSLNTYASSKILHRFVSMADVSGNRALFATVKDKTITTPILSEHYAIIMRKLGEFRRKQLKSEDIVPGRDKTPIEWKELHFLPYTEHDYLKRSRVLQNYLKETDMTMYGDNRDQVFHMIAKHYFQLSKRLVLGANDKNLKARYSGKGSIFPGNELKIILKQEKSGAVVEVPYVISPKLVEVAHLAATCPGKQFIYTSDPTTLRLLTWLLENLYDMTNIADGVKSGAITNKLLADRLARMKKPSPFRNFIALPSNVGLSVVQNFMNGVDLITERSGKTFEDATPERMLRNGQGQNCKILLVTGEMFTGVDINGLRGVHLVEPFASESSHAQARGRASRAGGHAFLPVTDRNAVVYHYHSKMVQYAGANKNGGKVTNMTVPVNQDANRVFTQHIAGHHPKRTLGAEGTKLVEGRQFIDGAVRRGVRNAVPREGGANVMNRGQALYSTPDDLMVIERVHGKHAREMADFRQEFSNAVRKR